MTNDVDLVIRSSRPSGKQVATRSVYRGLRLANPVLIVLTDCGNASLHHLYALRDALEAEILGPLGGEQVGHADEAIAVTCEGGSARPDAAAQKLLVLIGDDHSPPSAQAAALCDEWSAGGPGYSILPVFPLTARTSLKTLLPPSASVANAEFWRQHPREALPAVFACASITAEQPRLFISYRQIDSAALAMQIFDALSHSGFDVFLDHFRIPPGVNFQERLTQELGDKSMMLLLESSRLQESQWVAHEIAVAKSCGLGLLGLLLPGGKRQPSLEESNRLCLDDEAFEGERFSSTAILRQERLDDVVAGIKLRHDRALVARRRMLELSFEGALMRAGCHTAQRAGGAFQVTAKSRAYRVWLTTRPPEMPDFHRAHGAIASPEAGVVIGLSRLMEPARYARSAWLAGLCQLTLADEGQITSVARAIAAGRL